MKQESFDIIIVGGGIVGCCMAYALKDLPLRIGIIEARAIDENPVIPDMRAIALTYGSQYYLEKLGLWTTLAVESTSIREVHVSDRGHFGMTRFSAQEMNVPALGYVVPFDILQQHFQQAVRQSGAIEFLAPAQVTGLQKQDQQWRIDLQSPAAPQQTILGSLIIAADGSNSTIRRLQQIPSTEWDYQQTAIIVHVDLKRSHDHIAYERFNQHGAIAFLPCGAGQAALIWTVKNQHINDLLSLDDATFLKRLQQEFGYRAGRFIGMGKRQSYPLKMRHARQEKDAEIILTGNASHTLHPIAAQGLNLGLRDVAVLAQIVKKQVQHRHVLQGNTVNNAFRSARHGDQQQTMYFTDSLIRLFENNFLPLVVARNMGLTSFNYLPALKQFFSGKALGIIR